MADSESILAKLDLDAVSASRLWQVLDRDTKQRAAEAFYDPEAGERELQRGADKPIADAIRFRIATVRKLPVAKKARFLATQVKPEEALSTLLLQAYHLKGNRKILAAFLDALKIPHADGHIDDKAEFDPPDAKSLGAAADKLYKEFAAADVDLYLATLYAIDPGVWGELREALQSRVKG